VLVVRVGVVVGGVGGGQVQVDGILAVCYEVCGMLVRMVFGWKICRCVESLCKMYRSQKSYENGRN